MLPLRKARCRWLSGASVTLNLLPEPGVEVKGVCIISDGELASVAGGSSEEADLVLCVEGDAVAEAGQRRVAEDFQLFKGHLNVILSSDQTTTNNS